MPRHDRTKVPLAFHHPRQNFNPVTCPRTTGNRAGTPPRASAGSSHAQGKAMGRSSHGYSQAKPMEHACTQCRADQSGSLYTSMLHLHPFKFLSLRCSKPVPAHYSRLVLLISWSSKTIRVMADIQAQNEICARCVLK